MATFPTHVLRNEESIPGVLSPNSSVPYSRDEWERSTSWLPCYIFLATIIPIFVSICLIGVYHDRRDRKKYPRGISIGVPKKRETRPFGSTMEPTSPENEIIFPSDLRPATPPRSSTIMPQATITGKEETCSRRPGNYGGFGEDIEMQQQHTSSRPNGYGGLEAVFNNDKWQDVNIHCTDEPEGPSEQGHRSDGDDGRHKDSSSKSHSKRSRPKHEHRSRREHHHSDDKEHGSHREHRKEKKHRHKESNSVDSYWNSV